MLPPQGLPPPGISLPELRHLGLPRPYERSKRLRRQHFFGSQRLQGLLGAAHRLLPCLARVFFQKRKPFFGLLQLRRQHQGRRLQGRKFLPKGLQTGIELFPKSQKGRFLPGQKLLLPRPKRREILFQLPFFLHQLLRRTHVHLEGTQVQIHPEKGVSLRQRRV